MKALLVHHRFLKFGVRKVNEKIFFNIINLFFSLREESEVNHHY